MVEEVSDDRVGGDEPNVLENWKGGEGTTKRGIEGSHDVSPSESKTDGVYVRSGSGLELGLKRERSGRQRLGAAEGKDRHRDELAGAGASCDLAQRSAKPVRSDRWLGLQAWYSRRQTRRGEYRADTTNSST